MAAKLLPLPPAVSAPSSPHLPQLCLHHSSSLGAAKVEPEECSLSAQQPYPQLTLRGLVTEKVYFILLFLLITKEKNG